MQPLNEEGFNQGVNWTLPAANEALHVITKRMDAFIRTLAWQQGCQRSA